MVNNADHRGPGPDRAHRPLSSTETWRISLLHCDCTSAVSPPLGAAMSLICFGPGRVSAAGSNTCSTRVWRRRSKEELRSAWRERKYPFLLCLQPLICPYLSQAITLTQTQHVLLNMPYTRGAEGGGLSFPVLFKKWKTGWQLHADEDCINKT